MQVIDQAEESNRRQRCHNLMSARVDAAWAAAPDCDLTRLLQRQLVGRAWALLDGGDAECADRLLELLPDEVRMRVLNEFFGEDA